MAESYLNTREATMHNNDPSKTKYRVTIGHSEVIVEGGSIEEAIVNARQQLTLELPRLYDVIHSLDSTLFGVEQTA